MLRGWTVWSLPNMTGLLRKKVLDNLPPWSLYREIQGVAFMLNYSALTRAQVNAEGALLLLMKNASPWLHERLRETLKLLRRGRNLGQALDQNGYHFPSRLAIDRLILLTSGDHAEAIIENFAHNQLDKALKKITALASRLQLILYLLAGLYMGLVAYSTQNLSMMGS